mmetsp:Transcript_126/g.114  ORF Transcript_126/g.114 Transcript_126/m.114 type:complete len:89 (-) Transcript_126:87-353(-)
MGVDDTKRRGVSTFTAMAWGLWSSLLVCTAASLLLSAFRFLSSNWEKTDKPKDEVAWESVSLRSRTFSGESMTLFDSGEILWTGMGSY